MAADDALVGPTSAARRRLEAIRSALVAEMQRLLMRLDQKGGALASTRDALDNARRIRTQVLALLREDGLPVVMGAAEAAVADAVELALGPAQRAKAASIAPGLSVTLDAEAKASIERSVSGVLDEVAGVFGEAAQEIRAAVDLGVSTGVSLSDLTQTIAERMDVTFQKAAVAVETAVRGAHRLSLVQQAERGAEAADIEMVYLWLGPSDSKNRDICSRNVGRAFTIDALKRMDNGTDLPVYPHLGAYNCRHVLAPMPREMAEEDGIEVVE